MEALFASRFPYSKRSETMPRILIVDDEPGIVMLAKMMLEKAGYETDEVYNGEDCLKKLKKEKYDLILLDIMMPKGLDGWTVCKKIKADEKIKRTPVAMFTVRSSNESIEKSYSCGADAHLNKPFYKDELLQTVEDLIKESRS